MSPMLLLSCCGLFLAVCHGEYTESPPMKIDECPSDGVLLTKTVDAFDDPQPVLCLPHLTSLCIQQIEEQGLENTTTSVCCWYNKVDYFCCMNMTSECPEYNEKMVVMNKNGYSNTHHEVPDSLTDSFAAGYRARRRRQIENDRRQLQRLANVDLSNEIRNIADVDKHYPQKIHHFGRGVGGVAAAKSSYKLAKYKLARQKRRPIN